MTDKAAGLKPRIEKAFWDNLGQQADHGPSVDHKWLLGAVLDELETDSIVAVISELQAERDDLELRLASLLCDLTDGRMSKTNYDVRTMVREVEAAFERHYSEGESNG